MKLYKHYTIKSSLIHGVGAFANRRLHAGEKLDLAISYDFSFPGYNHSCNPNIMLGVGNKPWTHDMVLRDVKEGEELTVNYPLGVVNSFPCRCPTCRER